MPDTLDAGNLCSNLPADLTEESFETLASGAGPVRIERIISRGHPSPADFWYDQDEEEWVVVIQGAATICFADPGFGPRDLLPGDWLRIPARCRHRVAATSPDEDTVWLAVFYH